MSFFCRSVMGLRLFEGVRSRGCEPDQDAAGPPSSRCQPACVGSFFSNLLRQARRFIGIPFPRPYLCPCGAVCVGLAWPGILRPSHCGPPGGERGSPLLSFASVRNFSRSLRGTSCLATLPQRPARREGWVRAPQVSHRQPTSTCMRLRRIDSCGRPRLLNELAPYVPPQARPQLRRRLRVLLLFSLGCSQ